MPIVTSFITGPSCRASRPCNPVAARNSARGSRARRPAPTISKCGSRKAASRLLELLQQPVDVIQLLLRAAAFGGTAAQLQQDIVRPLHLGRPGNLHAIAEARRGAPCLAAERILVAALVAVLVLAHLLHQAVFEVARRAAQRIQRVLLVDARSVEVIRAQFLA